MAPECWTHKRSFGSLTDELNPQCVSGTVLGAGNTELGMHGHSCEALAGKNQGWEQLK